MTSGLELNTTQKGKIAEGLAASALMLASNGRLAPFLPLSDDCGIDIIVLDKATHRNISLQVKARIENPNRSSIQFGVRKASFRDDASRYLLGVLFDPANLAIAAYWFVPMARVAELAVHKSDIYALTPALSIDSNDRYREFRYDDPYDLVAAVLEATNGRAEKFHPPRMRLEG